MFAVTNTNFKTQNKNLDFPSSGYQSIKEPQILGHSLTLLLFMTSWASHTLHFCLVNVPTSAVRPHLNLSFWTHKFFISKQDCEPLLLKYVCPDFLIWIQYSPCLPRLGSYSMEFQTELHPTSQVPVHNSFWHFWYMPRFSSRYHIWQNTGRQVLLSGVDFPSAHSFRLPKFGHPDLSLCFFCLLSFLIHIPTD